MKDLIEVGQIVNTYGIHGFVKIKPFVDHKEQFKSFKILFLSFEKQTKELEVEEIRFSNDLVLAKLKGIETIEQAEEYRNLYLYAKRSDIPLEEGAHFIVDLIGLEVYTEDGKLLGNIKEVLQPGANDVYVVEDVTHKEILLPVIPDVIKKIDIDEKKVVVKLLKGLI